MRKLVLTPFFALVLLAGNGCKESDPNKFETHIENIRNADKRARGIEDLAKLVKSVVTSPERDARMAEFAEKVIPVFAEIWEEAPEQQENILSILRDAGHPGSCPVWEKALTLDGSAEGRKETLLALEGIKKARATACVDSVIAELDKLIADPRNDKGNEEGRVRLEMVEALGALRERKAVPVLLKAMEQEKENQPVAVHRGAATALGDIADPAAVDALLTVTFRIPDSPSTTDISNRSKLALVSIGDPAVDSVLTMLAGNHEAVNKLAAEHGVDMLVVKQTAAGILGAMGTKRATEDLVAFMPKEDCGGGKKGESDPDAASLRAFVARALGFIGDAQAVKPLCSCVYATHNPGDMYEIVQALGRIGGDEAFACVLDVVKNGEYNPEFLENSEYRYEIRWEAARAAILAGKPAEMAKVQQALAAQTNDKVKENVQKWEPGIKIAQDCGEDKGCYLKAVSNVGTDWFAREKAAVELARLAPGDEAAAAEIAKAFKVRDPDARVTMAHLPAVMLDGKPCMACVAAFEEILKSEKGSMDATMQLPVLTARNSIAKLTPRGVAAASPSPAGSAPSPEAPAAAEAKADPDNG